MASRILKNLNHHLLEKSTTFRCGIVPPHQAIESSASDIPGIFNTAIPADASEAWQTATGSIGRDSISSISRAIGEALERYCAFAANFPLKSLEQIQGEAKLGHEEFALFSEAQYEQKDFPWKKEKMRAGLFGEVYSLYDNRKTWVPQELIGLGSRSEQITLPSTSTGLAAHPNRITALLRGSQEVLERDALAAYWLNGLGGREIPLPQKYLDEVYEKSGEVMAFDITQSWNPHPVVIVCGQLPQRNRKRISLGVACRSTWDEAIEKAYLEWIQGCIFAGFQRHYQPELKFKKTSELKDFDAHAVYYSLYPEEWKKVPLLKKKRERATKIYPMVQVKATEIQMSDLLQRLKTEGIRLFYRNLTLPDVAQTGLKVVRVLSPDLSLLHGDENIPFLGGRIRDVEWRYPEFSEKDLCFPNPYPHPLA